MTQGDRGGMTAEDIARELGLSPIPVEGGRFGQTWADEHSSAIVFLVTPEDFSGLHVLPSPEVWFHHDGAPVRMLLLHPGGQVSEPVLGSDLASGQLPQVAVPPGVCMAAEPLGDWALLGTYMSPPYEESTVVFPSGRELVERYPAAASRIARLARD
ncbi:cupin domain-containing protein [Microbacterium sp. SORGH_AS_0888]|uniref:cupin domain-containing protein n=1 Tax=Microbacterium sp. SORGH_AS_0888 TaxID=3041791 RepID=UPI00277EB70D|nr:cupin domain-containing protein [Microbacterium sp. SORGH_AS_0888]MDQ1130316.1 putative cupin superfamily sugar epimerase [Microbacterium sp. SORGH_AS_0888]